MLYIKPLIFNKLGAFLMPFLAVFGAFFVSFFISSFMSHLQYFITLYKIIK